MRRLLGKFSISALLSSALVCFAIFIVVLAGLAYTSNRSAEESIDTLDQINIQQLSEISRADVLMLLARLELEGAAGLLYMRRDRAQEMIAEADDLLQRSQQHFENFQAVPKTEQGRVLTDPLESAYSSLVGILMEQHQALIDGDSSSFDAFKIELEEHASELDEAMTAFVHYANGRGESLMANYQAQIQLFEFIGLAVVLLSLIMLVVLRYGLAVMIVRPLNQAVTHFQHIANADLSHRISVYSNNEIGRLFAAMREMQQGLGRTVSTVRESSGSIHIGTREIASGNADLSSRTEQQAASIEETATSMEQLTATVKQNADNARQASTLANDASSTAGHGGEVVDQVITTMQGISTSSQKISDITGVIDSIAFQTNILALNASVEAARAGEQGRGFAVVAGEVRNLASRSAAAAKEIKTLIDDSVNQVQQGSGLVDQAGATMREVVSAVRRVTDIMDEISAASQEQSDGIVQVSTAITQLDDVTQQNASLVQQAAAAAASLEEQASRLEHAVSVFRLGEHDDRSTSMAVETPRMALPSAPPKTQAASNTPARSRQLATEGVDDWEEF